MRTRWVALALPALVASASPDPIWPWRPGVESLDLGDSPSSASCGGCHAKEYASWQASRHRASWTNDLMLAGYAAEPLAFCVHCHAPDPRAASEIAQNRAFYLSLDPRNGIAPGSVERAPEPHADDGIGCATCHWRGGAVLAPGPSFAPHATREVPALRDGSFCLPCHDFSMPVTVDGRTRATDVAMQATGAEWRAWIADGGQQTCQDCHMPGGDHRFRGASDRDLLRASVTVGVDRTGGRAVFTLRSVGVGHAMPTGDLFRRMTLEIAPDGEPFREIDSMGRRFERFDGAAGSVEKRLVADTALRPGEPRVVAVDVEGPARWRLQWRDGSPHDEARGLVPLDAIVVTLHEGAL